MSRAGCASAALGFARLRSHRRHADLSVAALRVRIERETNRRDKVSLPRGDLRRRTTTTRWIAALRTRPRV